MNTSDSDCPETCHLERKVDPSTEDGAITWPDPNRPQAVMCKRCGVIFPSEQMRRQTTEAERKLWRRQWVLSSSCRACRKASKKPLGPKALRSKLLYDRCLPPEIVKLRVAVVESKREAKRVAAIRAGWAARYKQETGKTLAALKLERSRFAARAHFYENKKGEDGTLVAPDAAEAMRNYAQFLTFLSVKIRLRAREGKAPVNPWYENVRIDIQTLRLFRKIVEGLNTAIVTNPAAMATRFPAWWMDRDRLYEGKRPVTAKNLRDSERPRVPSFDGDFEKLRRYADSRYGWLQKVDDDD